MFEGFSAETVDVGGSSLFVRRAGEGPPVVLLHGYPQHHVCWHRVAPALVAEGFSVICPDLRGYGRSAKPVGGDYAKRAMAVDVVDLLDHLGHERAAVVGHDRGARVAYRTALDHPERVSRLAVLDIMPTVEQWERMTGTQTVGSWHWPFLAQPSPIPETLIAADPGWFCRLLIERWAGDAAAIDAEAMAAYVDAFRDPATVAATCDDYRAGATVDVDVDRADREVGRRITCPTLALWGDRGAKGNAAMEAVWRAWADHLTVASLPCGHFLAEEAPEATAAALTAFLRAGAHEDGEGQPGPLS